MISQEIEGSYAAWSGETGKFLLLEEPAWYVLSLYEAEIPVPEIAERCRDEYGLDYSHCLQFVNDAIDIWRSPDSGTAEGPPLSDQEKSLLSRYVFDPVDTINYQIGSHTFSVSYHTEKTRFCIHPVLSHLEVKPGITTDHHIELIETNEKIITRVDGEVTDHCKAFESGFLKASVLLRLTGLIHHIEPGDWMLTVHASGVTDGNTSILFPARAGGGKSTLAALLKANGWPVISDDFISIARGTKHVFGLPAAITVKEGSVAVLAKYFPELTAKDSEKAYTGKMVRYLPLYPGTGEDLKGYPVKCFVFVNYSPGKKFLFEKISRKEAVQILLSEAWIIPVAENVRLFFEWITTIKFYRLTYHDEEEAITVISKLFRS